MQKEQTYLKCARGFWYKTRQLCSKITPLVVAKRSFCNIPTTLYSHNGIQSIFMHRYYINKSHHVHLQNISIIQIAYSESLKFLQETYFQASLYRGKFVCSLTTNYSNAQSKYLHWQCLALGLSFLRCGRGCHLWWVDRHLIGRRRPLGKIFMGSGWSLLDISFSGQIVLRATFLGACHGDSNCCGGSNRLCSSCVCCVPQ